MHVNALAQHCHRTPIPYTTTVIDDTAPDSALVVEVRQPPRETIGQYAEKRYKKRNARVQKKLAALGITSNERELVEEEEDEEEYESIPEPDARGELNSEALAQAERAAAARPGVNGRIEDAIERIIDRG